MPSQKVSAGAPAKHNRGLLTTEQKGELCKAVAISGMSSDQHNAIGIKAKSLGTVTAIDVEVPVTVASVAKLKQDGCPDGAILVHYASVKEAMEAVWNLHRCKHKSGGKSVTLWARQVNGEGASVRSDLQPPLLRARPRADIVFELYTCMLWLSSCTLDANYGTSTHSCSCSCACRVTK